MLLHCKHLRHKIYDEIRSNINQIYGIDMNCTDDIIMNAIPIKYNNNYWIVSSLASLEISSLELDKQSYEVKYIINDEIKGNIPINNVCSLHDTENRKNDKTIDCLYDEHLNIMFIKFQDIRIEYFDITDYEFDWFDNFENCNMNFTWLNNLLVKKTIISPHNKIVFEDKFINLPSIPYVVSETKLINELVDKPMIDYPCTGATVLNELGQLMGIVSYVGKNNIVSIPVNLIKKSLGYLNFIPIYNMNVNLTPIKINYKNELDANTTEYGLYFKKKEANSIIMSIDNYSICPNGDLLIRENTVPLSAYLWLFKNDNIVKIKGISLNTLKNIRINKEEEDLYYVELTRIENIKFNYYKIKLLSNTETALSISKLNYIEYNKKYLIEINEKIMQILKILFQTTNNYDNLYDYINENKCSNKRIVISINSRMNIKIIKKIKNIPILNINNIIKLFPKKNMIKKYITDV
jgi:hypothetical protein